MRRRSRHVFFATLVLVFAAACNAILGNESATFVPEGDAGLPPGPEGSSGEAGTDGPVTTDAPVDTGVDAPCITDADTLADPKNCGACGHDCLGGGCEAGTCQPLLIALDAVGPNAVAVDATHVYWQNPTTAEIRRAPITGGGASELLYTGTVDDFGETIGVSGADVYFSEPTVGRIARCAKTGCGTVATTVVASLASPRYIAVANGAVYWGEFSTDGGVGRCALPCVAPTNVVSNEVRPARIVVDGNDIFWTTLVPTTVRAKLGAAPPITIAPATGAFYAGVAAAGDRAFFASSGVGPHVMQRDGGAKQLMTPGVTEATSIVADGTHLYFAENFASSRILRCSVAGCGAGPTPIADGQDKPKLVLDSKSLVWVTEGGGDGGAVWRVAK